MDTDLDDRLLASAPPLKEVPDLQPVIADLVAATRSTRSRGRGRRRGAIIGTTTAGIVLAGTAAAAALGIGGWTTPWGKEPDGVIAFTLPSGVACEMRVGNISSSSPEFTHDLQAWLDDHTLDQVADVDATLKAMRAEGNTFHREDGTEVKVGYGTPYYDADNEYYDAVVRAIDNAIGVRADKAGLFDKGGELSNAGELHCANGWEPDSTWLP